MPHNQPVIAVEARDGHRFELIHIPARSPRTSLLFLPGMGLTARQYIAFGRALADNGVEVFIHEWRGNGSSSLRAGRGFDWGYRELLEIDLLAAVEAVARNGAVATPLIGGHSLGSQFACLLAAITPDRCGGLVLVAGGSPWWKLFGLRMKVLMLMVIVGFPLISRLIGYYPGKRLGFAGREARGVIRDWTRSARTGRYEFDSIATDLEAAMAALNLPVLALDMAEDWFVPESSLQWLTGKLGHSDVTHQALTADSLEGRADHYAWMKKPRVTVDRILEWMHTTEASKPSPR